jgi:ABC transporter DrrB family efflux protein
VSAFTSAVSDGAIIARRNLIKVKRVPDLLVGTLISPIMFILLFVYVFGSAIPTPPGVSYAEFLVPGIFAQTVIFGATITGSGLAQDMQKGIIDRFRSLPIAPSAVLVGRTTSDLVTNVLVVLIMVATGLVVGWRINTGPLQALAGFVVLLAFAYALSWVMALFGLLVRSPEVFNNVSFIVIFPLTFIANTFVPQQGFPTVLRVIADWNPVSAVAQASRDLFGNDSLAQGELPWSLEHPVAYTLIWSVALVAVFLPLSTRQYKRSAAR